MPDGKRVVVHIQGGLVNDVEKPADIEVHIIDLDTEGQGDEDICTCEMSSKPHLHGEY